MKIFYLHIPKTGGQTLASRLASSYPSGMADILGEDFSFPDGINKLEQLLEQKDFIERHINGHVLAKFDKLEILTTIREPTAQIVSNYLHIKREPTNFLYRVANTLNQEMFFLKFGDFLANHQSKYLVSAFFEKAITPNPARFMLTKLFEALDRINWVIPSESIDEFTQYWMMESKRFIPNNMLYVNVAPKSKNYDSLIELVKSMPNLYSIDLILWQEAHKRYSAYKDMVMRNHANLNLIENANNAFNNGISSINLCSGWYPPEENTKGTIWWAGPEKYSEIIVIRKSNEVYLSFAVNVLCGLSFADIHVISSDMITKLPLNIISTNDSTAIFTVDLTGTSLQNSVYIWVPEVYAAILMTSNDFDLSRKSFATSNWQLSNANENTKNSIHFYN